MLRKRTDQRRLPVREVDESEVFVPPLSDEDLAPRALMERLTSELGRKIEESFAARKRAVSN